MRGWTQAWLDVPSLARKRRWGSPCAHRTTESDLQPIALAVVKAELMVVPYSGSGPAVMILTRASGSDGHGDITREQAVSGDAIDSSYLVVEKRTYLEQTPSGKLSLCHNTQPRRTSSDKRRNS